MLMYSAQVLQANFSGLVGFAPSSIPIPISLLISDSGKLVQYVHPLCQMETIDSTAPDTSQFVYPAWTAKAYIEGQIVVFSDNKIYHAASNTLATDQPGTSSKWEQVSPFGAWLKTIYNQSVLELVADFIRLKSLENSNRTLLSSQILFDGVGQFAQRIINTGQFVGLSFTLSSQEGIQAVIDKIGLQLDQEDSITLYLYHTSVNTPLLQFEVDISSRSSFNWQKPAKDLLLKYFEDRHNAGGRFFLGYYQDDLTAQAIRYDYDFAAGPCAGCNESNSRAFNNWSKYVKINSFAVPSSALNADKTLFNNDKAVYNQGGNYGMNVALTVACDMTEYFSLNKNLFAQALSMKLCLKLISVIANSTRINAVEQNTKAIAFAELSLKDADSFQNQYLNELKSLSLNFSGMSSACMPCSPKAQGVKFGAI